MTSRRKIAALFVLLSVTTGLAQQADPLSALQSAREQLLEELKSLPRYTCVQEPKTKPLHHGAPVPDEPGSNEMGNGT